MTLSASASPAYRDPGAPFWAWLPPHLRHAGSRHGFGLREGATLRVLHARGTLWYSDNGAAIDSGIPATGAAPDGSLLLDGLLAGPHREPSMVIALPDRVLVGETVISPAYHGLVSELYPEARWCLRWFCREVMSDAVELAIAVVGPRPVALVMPMRSTE
jgi:hypothetical protein